MITKRQLGIIVIALSVLEMLGILAVHILGLGQWQGFGPVQQIGVGLGLATFLVGLVLLGLGDRPA